MATEEDINLLYTLWIRPDVLKQVGFPNDIPLDLDEMKDRPFEHGETAFDQLLEVMLKDTGQGVIEPDIQLLPEFRGKGYGRESWLGIVSYIFEHTHCEVIQTTPNVEHIAAIKVYEAAGAVLTGEDVYHFPDLMQEFTTPVHCYHYRLYRMNWQNACIYLSVIITC